MSTSEAYAVVVRSRGNPDRAASVLTMLPDSFVFIDERERDDYESAIAPARIRTHPAVSGEAAQLNAVLDAFEEPALVLFTDAFTSLYIINDSGRYRKVTDPAMCVDVIENTLQCAIDADLGMFRWAAAPDIKRYSACDPFDVCGGLFYPFGVRGPARHRRFNENLPADKFDIAWALQTIMEDRIVLVDKRFSFDHGAVDMSRDILVRRRAPEVDGEMEFKLLVDARDEPTLARLYEDMIAGGFDAKLIT